MDTEQPTRRNLPCAANRDSDQPLSGRRPRGACRPALSRFRTTRWSLIAAAAGATAEARASLGELCQIYWLPVYTFVRRRGHGPDEARDLTQAFFTSILGRNDLAKTDPQRGRFRSWLLGAVKHFLWNDWRYWHAKERDVGITISIDTVVAEGHYVEALMDSLTPEHIYARKWTLMLLERAMARLEREYSRSTGRNRFEKLRTVLVGNEPPYKTLAHELGETVGNLRVQVHRLRRRYRDLVREEIAETVETPADIDDELRKLFAALS